MTLNLPTPLRRAFVGSFAAITCALTSPVAEAEDRTKLQEWHPERSPAGPVLVVVSLDDQWSYVYRNGIEIGRCAVSTGKSGHETPTGVFSILNKDADHHSSTYNNASMPYSERLTWDGVALHAGGLPGYPSSHGCIHLPFEFSKKLFGVTHKGGTVIITKAGVVPRSDKAEDELKGIAQSAALQDLDSGDDSFLHNPEKNGGHLSLIISSADRRIEVMQGDKLIGKAPIALHPKVTGVPHAAYLKQAPIKGNKNTGWVTVDIARGDNTRSAGQILGSDVRMPNRFAAKLGGMIEPGSLLITTPEPLHGHKRSQGGFVIARPKR